MSPKQVTAPKPEAAGHGKSSVVGISTFLLRLASRHLKSPTDDLEGCRASPGGDSQES